MSLCLVVSDSREEAFHRGMCPPRIVWLCKEEFSMKGVLTRKKEENRF
jgi:hypothetical protein